MRSPFAKVLASALAFAAPLLASTAASAQSAASCGNIHVEASAQCEVVPPSIECEGQCKPVSFVAACEGKCSLSASASCKGGCTGECKAKCDVNPGQFDCNASCQAECGTLCEGHCAADANSAECEAKCSASCGGSCQAKCEVVPPSADCTGKCEASCEASCNVEANVDCAMDCTAELQGGCEVACKGEEGALFCDGQYVDHGNNLDECLDYLASIGVTVEGYAECEGNSCEAGCSAQCAQAPAPIDPASILAGLTGLGALLARRRGRRG